jgi:hypothetical protein
LDIPIGVEAVVDLELAAPSPVPPIKSEPCRIGKRRSAFVWPAGYFSQQNCTADKRLVRLDYHIRAF